MAYQLQIWNDGVGTQGWTSQYLGHGVSDEDATFETREQAEAAMAELQAMWPEVQLRVIEA